jgi:outer membrane protein
MGEFMLKKYFVLVFVSVMFPAAVFAAEFKVAVINMQRAVAETDEGMAALKKLKAKLDADAKVLQGKQDELKKMDEEMAAQGYMMSESAKAEKQDKFRRAVKEYEKIRDEKNKAFSEAQKEITDKILKKLHEIIKTYSKSEGYSLVLESGPQLQGLPGGSVLHYEESMDITDKVIRMYDVAAKNAEKQQ